MKTFYKIEEYQQHKKICEDRKTPILEIYNEVMYYTTPVGSVSTEKTSDSIPRNINASIYEAAISFKNFTMYALFGTRTKWAKSDVILALLKKKYETSSLENVVKQYKKTLDKITDDVFEYIMTSNYEKEIGKSLFDWGELGTGCWEILEKPNSLKNPFTNRHVPLNELLFNNDTSGEPNIIFRYKFDCELFELESRYPAANFELYRDPKYVLDDFKKITVIECVMPYTQKQKDGKEEKIYEWLLFDETMNNILDRQIYDYNPYNVVVFSELPNTCWGMGLGIISLDSYERLNYYENLRARQGSRIVEPPLGVVGDKSLMDNMTFEPNSLNWLGDGINGRAEAYPINTTGSLLPIEKDIERMTNQIQQLHFNNPFGSADNRTTRAVEEVQYRMQLLQQKFSDAVANLYSNVLIPAFEKPKIILQKRGIIPTIEEDEFFQPKFINLLTKTVENQKVDSVIKFMQITGAIFPQTAPFSLKEKQTISMIAESLEIPEKVLESDEEIEAKRKAANEQQIQAQLLASQMGGGQ